MRRKLSPVLAALALLGCAHAGRADAARPSTSPDGLALEIAPGDTLEVVRARLGPGVRERVLSSRDRLLTVTFDRCVVEPCELRTLHVHFRDGKVLTVGWTRPSR